MSAGYRSYCVCFLTCTCLPACACVFTYILFCRVRGVFCVCALTCASVCVCVVAVWACGHRAGQFCEQTACLLGESLPGLSTSPGHQHSHPLNPLVPVGACRAQAWAPGLRGAVGEAFRILPE